MCLFVIRAKPTTAGSILSYEYEYSPLMRTKMTMACTLLGHHMDKGVFVLLIYSPMYQCYCRTQRYFSRLKSSYFHGGNNGNNPMKYVNKVEHQFLEMSRSTRQDKQHDDLIISGLSYSYGYTHTLVMYSGGKVPRHHCYSYLQVVGIRQVVGIYLLPTIETIYHCCCLRACIISE